ncbi:hypothetical protein Pan97_39810 [Bremerella volcania]|uniref:Uncharacterized protein n=1 Tax=Bremerella volcania TaxID=2527984 RepID=A0A518CCK0_9BACT|nr:hypothetical protein [Bremerella volcania]QDU76924.1 hypothetical protein Pan97_39810 [Bremerella volcania]
MTQELYRYTFEEDVPIEEVEASLLLAVMATESLHGEAQTRLDAAHYLDPTKRACVVDAGTPVGRDLNRLFTGFMGREFGPDAFTVERIANHEHQPQEAAA